MRIAAAQYFHPFAHAPEYRTRNADCGCIYDVQRQCFRGRNGGRADVSCSTVQRNGEQDEQSVQPSPPIHRRRHAQTNGSSLTPEDKGAAVAGTVCYIR